MERYRIRPDASVYFITYSIVDWLPVFVSEQACKIVTDSFMYCHRHKQLRINSYVIMPTHLHAIVFDGDFDTHSLEKTMLDFRKFTGRQLSDFCMRHAPPCFTESFHGAASLDRERRFWQPSRHPEAIETEKFWKQKLDFIHENLCRKGLVIRGADWRFSSARYFATDGREQCDVVVSALDWG